MAINIYIVGRHQNPPRHGSSSQDQRVATLDDDGYFAFLSRYFETIEDECGFVDLHGDNTYYKEELLKLQECLIDAEKELESRPDVWSEYIGTWLNEAGGEIYDKVEKVKLAELIGSLSRAANEAYTSDKELLFFGD